MSHPCNRCQSACYAELGESQRGRPRGLGDGGHVRTSRAASDQYQLVGAAESTLGHDRPPPVLEKVERLDAITCERLGIEASSPNSSSGCAMPAGDA